MNRSGSVRSLPVGHAKRPTEQSAMAARQARNAFAAAVVMATGCLLVGTLCASVAISSAQTVTEIRAVPVAPVAVGLVAVLCAMLIRRGRVVSGIRLMLASFLAALVFITLVLGGLGLASGLSAMLITSAIAVQALPSRQARPMIVSGVGVGLAIMLADEFWPFYREPAPEAINTIVPIVAVPVGLALAVMIARQFVDYSLRARLVMTMTALVGVSVFAVLYFAANRIQQTTETLRIALETSVRAEAEQLLVYTLEADIISADEILRSVRDDAIVLASYVGDLLSQQATLGQGDYWDARRRLAQLPDGHWDNPNTETASVLVPSIARLTPSELSEINAARYLDLIAPKVLGGHPQAVALYFISAANGATVYYPNIDLANVVGDYDPRPQSFYLVAAPENNPERQAVWTPPYQDPALTGLLVTSSAPVYDRAGGFRGVLAMDIQLAGITDLVAGLEIGESGYAFLIDEDAHVIAMPDAGYADFGLAREDVPPGEPIRQTLLGQGSPELQEVVSNMVSAQRAVTTLDIGRVEHYVAYAPLATARYSLGLVVPTAELNQAIIAANARVAEEAARNRQFTALALTAVLGLAALASAGIGQLLAAPLERLTRAAQIVTSGDLNAQAEVRSNDEIGALAAAFNVMTARLRDVIGSLEARVAERTEQLRASADVGRAAASILDPDRLMREVVDLIAERFGFYYAAVFILDKSGEHAVLRTATGEAGRALVERGHKLAVGGQSMVGYVTAQRKPRIALDVGAEPVRFANPLLPDTRSEIALPLVVGDRVLGALDVQSTQEAAFDSASAEVLQSMADQIAVALSNATSYAEAQAAARQARALYVASQQVGRLEVGLMTMADEILRAVSETSGFNQWWVLMLDESRKRLNTLSATPDFDRTPSLSVDEHFHSPVVRCALAGETLVLSDPWLDPHLVGDPAEQRLPIKSVCTPIVARGSRIGALVVGWPLDASGIGEPELQVSRSLASLISVAAESRGLFEQTRRALNELDAINRRLTGEAWAEQFQRRADGWRVQVAQSGLEPVEEDTLSEIEMAVMEQQAVAWVHPERSVAEPALSAGEGSKGADQPSPALAQRGSPYRSAMAAPIMLRGEVIGALQVGDVSRARVWRNQDLAFIQAVADQVALAVENARLLEQTQRVARRERAIAEAADRIHRPVDLDTILRTAIEEVVRITGSTEVSIQLGLGAGTEPTPSEAEAGDA